MRHGEVMSQARVCAWDWVKWKQASSDFSKLALFGCSEKKRSSLESPLTKFSCSNHCTLSLLKFGRWIFFLRGPRILTVRNFIKYFLHWSTLGPDTTVFYSMRNTFTWPLSLFWTLKLWYILTFFENYLALLYTCCYWFVKIKQKRLHLAKVLVM